jgi:mRNA interferase MazF
MSEAEQVAGPRRGEIWWADLGEPRGSEPGKRRPVIVVQSNRLNHSRLNTVMVVPLTSRQRRAAALGNVALSKRQTKLRVESVALACQIETLDRMFLDQLVTRLDRTTMLRIDAALRLNLELGNSAA